MDMGQATDVGIAQIVADELDVRYDQVKVIMGDTALTLNQGGASGSTGIEQGGRPLRNAAAEARRVLVGLAAEKLKLPADQLRVVDGVVQAASDPTKKATYGELIGGKFFDVKLEWNGQVGNGLNATGVAKPKPASEYKVVGKSFPRPDLPDIVFGTHEYVVDIKVPGMVHGRVVRPPVAGAVPVAVDESSIKGIPGARVVRVGDWLGVAAEREWDAIKASQALKVTWSDAKPPFPKMETIYDYIRKAPPSRESAGGQAPPDVKPDTAAAEAAFAKATRTIEAEYEFPFQSHASMGSACAVVDYRGTHATVWTGSQKPHYAAEGVARITGLPVENVHGIWVQGPGSYGRNDAGDAAMDAALMSKALGRPVRMQGMRFEGHAWNPKAPASVHYGKAGIDDKGNVVAFLYRSKGFSAGDMMSNESNPSDTYAGMLTGWPNATVHRFGNPDESYQFPVKVQYWQTVAPLLAKASPLRTAHMRDPLGPQIHFGYECFIDEVAHSLGADSVAFRLAHIKAERDIAVIKAAAEKYGWQPRVAGPAKPATTGTVTGRGFAYAKRGNSITAMVAEVDVDVATGRVWPRKFTVATDQGIVVNPLWLRRTIEGNIVMGSSRSIHEEVAFDEKTVTSVDWETYPILDISLAPETIDIVLVNRPDLPPYGAGEPTSRPVSAAIANAIFDATGVRMRRVPFNPARVKASLQSGRA